MQRNCTPTAGVMKPHGTYLASGIVLHRLEAEIRLHFCCNTCHLASGWNNDIKASAADVIIAKFFHDRHA